MSCKQTDRSRKSPSRWSDVFVKVWPVFLKMLKEKERRNKCSHTTFSCLSFYPRGSHNAMSYLKLDKENLKRASKDHCLKQQIRCRYCCLPPSHFADCFDIFVITGKKIKICAWIYCHKAFLFAFHFLFGWMRCELALIWQGAFKTWRWSFVFPAFL